MTKNSTTTQKQRVQTIWSDRLIAFLDCKPGYKSIYKGLSIYDSIYKALIWIDHNKQ